MLPNDWSQLQQAAKIQRQFLEKRLKTLGNEASKHLDALQEKIEDLARNNHEVWASSRISEGWRYGPGLDREKREHPSLVPYELLPESE